MSEPLDIPPDLLLEVCARHDIPAGDEFLVVDALRKKTGLGACCGSGCRPCVLDVEAAEAELREKLASRHL